MFPHERSLVKRLENKPFALIGINSDTDPQYRRLMAEIEQAKDDEKDKKRKELETFDWSSFKKSLREKNENQQITWRSFWNGPEGTGGPISQKWNVRGWPTLYIIDHKGVIRHKWVGSPGPDALDKAIDELVEEAGKAAG